jgi:hypothetical protein
LLHLKIFSRKNKRQVKIAGNNPDETYKKTPGEKSEKAAIKKSPAKNSENIFVQKLPEMRPAKIQKNT